MLSSLNVLVVEDTSFNWKVVDMILKRMDIAATHASSGEAAIEEVKKGNYDVILMDVQMPGMDGIEATKLIRDMPTIKQPWIIALTAHAMTDDAQRMLDAGMNDYLSKPIKKESLEAALAKVNPK